MRAKAVVVNADPFRLRELVGAQHFCPQLNSKLDGMRKDGTTLKVRGWLHRAAGLRVRSEGVAGRDECWHMRFLAWHLEPQLHGCL